MFCAEMSVLLSSHFQTTFCWSVRLRGGLGQDGTWGGSDSVTAAGNSWLLLLLLLKTLFVSLQEVKVQVISAEKCQSWFKQAHR